MENKKDLMYVILIISAVAYFATGVLQTFI